MIDLYTNSFNNQIFINEGYVKTNIMNEQTDERIFHARIYSKLLFVAKCFLVLLVLLLEEIFLEVLIIIGYFQKWSKN